MRKDEILNLPKKTKNNRTRCLQAGPDSKKKIICLEKTMTPGLRSTLK